MEAVGRGGMFTMENYEVILRKVLNEKDVGNFENYLKDYFVIVEEIDIDAIIKNHNKFRQLIQEFEKKYMFSKYLIAENKDDEIIFIKLIHSIRNSLRENDKKILYLFPLLIYLDENYILFNSIQSETEELKMASLQILKSFSYEIGVCGIPQYNWEISVINKYRQGHLNLDFINIHNAIDALERGRKIPRNSFIILAAHIMAKNYIDEFVKFLDQKNDAIEIKILIESIAAQEKLKIAKKSKNFLMKFEIIRELIYLNEFYLENTMIDEISEVFIEFSQDIQIWRNFIMYYLSFPTRSPNFFLILGKIFNKIEEKSLLILFESVRLHENIMKGEVEIINSCFIEENMENASIKILYERWKTFINDKKTLTTLIETSYINVIINYIMNVMEDSEFEFEINKSFYKIKEIENFWFETKIDQMTFFYKNMSILYVLGFRAETRKKIEMLDVFGRSNFLSVEIYEIVKENWGF